MGRMYCTCASSWGATVAVRVAVEPVGCSRGWRTGRGVCACGCGMRSCNGWAGLKDPPTTRLGTRSPPRTGVTLTGPGEEDEDRYPPPTAIGSC